MGSHKRAFGRQGGIEMLRSEERFRRAVHFDSSTAGPQRPAIDHISQPTYSQVITDGPSLVYPSDPYLTDYSRPSPVVEAALRDNHMVLTANSPNLCRTERDLQAAENTHNFVYRTVAPTPSFVPDDLTYKMRPDTAHVVGRDYARYEPSWTWADFQRSSPAPELVHRPSYSRSVPLSSFMAEPRPYKPRSALWTPDTKENPSTLSKMNYRTWRDQERETLPVSSRLNTAFPFRKYRPDFTPYAPHQNLYDAAKYAPTRIGSLFGRGLTSSARPGMFTSQMKRTRASLWRWSVSCVRPECESFARDSIALLTKTRSTRRCPESCSPRTLLPCLTSA